MRSLENIYNISPIWAQNLMCSVKGALIKRQRYNEFFFSALEGLLSTQTWTEDNIRRYKEEHLFQIIEYAYQNVPFYKWFYDTHHVSPKDYHSLDDIKKFPVLTKDLIRDNYKDMVSTVYPSKDLISNHTSGSTGKALDFYQTKESLPFIWAVWWRFRNRNGIEFNEKSLNFTGKLIVPMASDEPPYWRINRPLNQWLLNMQHITKEKIGPMVDMINQEHFSFFSGYPSIIYAFSSVAQEMGLICSSPPKAIFTGAEKMYDYQEKDIQALFPDTLITDHYGTSEGVVNASKCKRGHYHEDFELGHIECENPRWLSNTQYEGDIIGTCFKNFGMPFIRYKIGDSAIWSTEKCDCGLHSQVIKDIQGRSEDYVITPEGTKIMRFDYLFKDTTDIKECQVVQNEYGVILFRIVRRDNYTIKTEDKLKRKVAEIISPTMACKFEYVPEIERTSAGKFKAVVSNLK